MYRNSYMANRREMNEKCNKIRAYLRTEQVNLALSEVKRLEQQYPENMEVFELYLRVLTNDYTQLEPQNIAEAERCYRILASSGYISSEAQEYYYRRVQKMQEGLERKYKWKKLIVLGYLFAMLFVTLGGAWYYSIVPLGVMIWKNAVGEFLEARENLITFYEKPRAF